MKSKNLQCETHICGVQWEKKTVLCYASLGIYMEIVQKKTYNSSRHASSGQKRLQSHLLNFPAVIIFLQHLWIVMHFNISVFQLITVFRSWFAKIVMILLSYVFHSNVFQSWTVWGIKKQSLQRILIVLLINCTHQTIQQ